MHIRRLRDLLTNHPVCAATERDLFIEAQPPLLENGGEWSRFATNPLPRVSKALETGECSCTSPSVATLSGSEVLKYASIHIVCKIWC